MGKEVDRQNKQEIQQQNIQRIVRILYNSLLDVFSFRRLHQNYTYLLYQRHLHHVTKMCKKTSNKIHAFGRVAKYMGSKKIKLIMQTFIENEFNYCPLIWMMHNRTLYNKINKLHERALRIALDDDISSYSDLLVKSQSYTIHDEISRSLLP